MIHRDPDGLPDLIRIFWAATVDALLKAEPWHDFIAPVVAVLPD